jgi:tRNA(fMet)-specific endonuclease VapC
LKYLLDTNICIYSLKKRPPEVLERLRRVGPAAVAISVVTVLELRHGAEKSHEPERSHRALDLFFRPMPVLAFDVAAAEAAGRIRAELDHRGAPIGDLDSLIAAHAVSRGLVLVTNNLREFERVQGLRTDNWVGGG